MLSPNMAEPSAAWHQQLLTAPPLRALANALARGESAVASGARAPVATLAAAAVARQTHRPVLLVVAHLDEADDAVDELEAWLGNEADDGNA